MKLFADLHLHSHYSRATSKEMNIIDLSRYAKLKGLDLLGTGDFQHPKYLDELKKNLKPTNNGFFEFNNTLFVLQTEVANIYSHNGKTRRIHHVILVPDFNTADKVQALFKKWGRIDYDGRPIFGVSSELLVNSLMNINPLIEVIPAHIWTPWFGLFGSKSGYDSISECYGSAINHIHALETGLSSDPEMNWRLSSLDNYTLLSNSDSHSPWPWRLGRECNLFDINPSYESLIKAIRSRKGLIKTIEVDPAYGKYHWDGHRDCNISLSPKEAEKLNNICPVCGKPLTIGVEHRVEELADRPVGFKPEGAVPFIKLIPLTEIIAKFIGKGISTKSVWKIYYSWINHFGSELNLMLNAPKSEVINFDNLIGEAIINVREQRIKIKPGFDGEYGVPIFKHKDSQQHLNSFF